MKQVVVIGAGIGGLTTAAALARAGLEVTVLEAHIYPGGSAGTFYHQGYQFDAGATLAAGFYAGGSMDRVANAAGIDRWPARPANPAMMVHLPDGTRVNRWTDSTRWEERSSKFGPDGEAFWKWQESTADAIWSLALRGLPWPPQGLEELQVLLGGAIGWLIEDPRAHAQTGLIADALRPIRYRLRGATPRLRQFIDAQLLISAQTTNSEANALYAAAALDMPRRGVVHLEGGMGAIASNLAQAMERNGGRIHYRSQVEAIRREHGKIVAVRTKGGKVYIADLVIANMTPWDIARLEGVDFVPRLRGLPEWPDDGWGAFVIYLGVDTKIIDQEFPLHHQVILGEPMGEGNTIFLSMSPEWDPSRAPSGRRAVTISTHTAFAPWWEIFEKDKDQYEMRKEMYVERLLDAAERVLPGLRSAADLILPGTPVTFQRFTRRRWGWVGGFPQTRLNRTWGPRLAPGLWMVGDSIFPGQSTAAVALGGLRVADSVLRELKQEEGVPLESGEFVYP